VWPSLRRSRPGITLQIIGRRPGKIVRRLATMPGVEVIGTVPDVRPYVHRAAIAIAPLRLARGLQNKVLEALAMGKATIASAPALAALRVEPGRHLLTASTAGEWQAAVLRLLDDDGLKQQLGAAGRHYVEEHHSWERCLQPLVGLLGIKE